MKNTPKIIFYALPILFLSCGNRENRVDKMETSDSVSQIDSALIDRTDANNDFKPGIGKDYSPHDAWLRLLNDYKGQPPGSGDKAFKAFLEMQEKELTRVNEWHKSSSINESLADAIVNKKKLTPRQKLFVDSVEANGFVVDVGEGMSYIVRDWSFFLRDDLSFFSPGVRSFIEQINKDEKQGFAKDASLTISPVQLTDRVVWWKKFRDENPNFILKEIEEQHTDRFLQAIVYGTDNTPLLTGSNKLFDFYVMVREHLAKNYPNTPVSELLLPYYKELETDPASAKRKITQKVKNF